MTYRYCKEEWGEIKLRMEEERIATAIAYAEDMDNMAALRDEQNARSGNRDITIRASDHYHCEAA